MEIGRVISLVGNEIVVKAELPAREEGEGVMGLKAVKDIMGRHAHCGRTEIGRVYDLIGSINAPYFVIKTYKGAASELIGKTVNVGGFKNA